MEDKTKEQILEGMSKLGRFSLKALIKTSSILEKMGQKQYDKMMEKEKKLRPPNELK